MRLLLLAPLLASLPGCTHSGPPATAPSTATASPLPPDALRQRADVAYAAKDWAAAERDYLTLASSVPASGLAPFKLGNLYIRTGRLAEAEAAYAEATRREPAMTRAWHNLGVVQLRQARSSLSRATEGNDAEEAATAARARGLVDGIDLLLAPGAP